MPYLLTFRRNYISYLQSVLEFSGATFRESSRVCRTPAMTAEWRPLCREAHRSDDRPAARRGASSHLRAAASTYISKCSLKLTSTYLQALRGP